MNFVAVRFKVHNAKKFFFIISFAENVDQEVVTDGPILNGSYIVLLYEEIYRSGLSGRPFEFDFARPEGDTSCLRKKLRL
jgi:hypothetical protein